MIPAEPKESNYVVVTLHIHIFAGFESKSGITPRVENRFDNIEGDIKVCS